MQSWNNKWRRLYKVKHCVVCEHRLIASRAGNLVVRFDYDEEHCQGEELWVIVGGESIAAVFAGEREE